MAKTKISEFDSNPANNTDIDGINLAEGMAPGLVNNAIRELMAQLKDYQAGLAGDNVTVGGNLSVAGTSSFTGNAAFSGTLTLSGRNVDAFPSGTKMLFQQTSAPVGWTKDTTHDNKALRVVTGTAGSGGSVNFTTAFASQSVGGTALTEANLPSHLHTYSGNTGGQSNDHAHSGTTASENQNHTHSGTTGGHSVDHAHFFSAGTSGAGAHSHSTTYPYEIYNTDGPQNLTGGNGGSSGSHEINGVGDHSHSVSGWTGGVSTDHSHNFTTSGISNNHQHAFTTGGVNQNHTHAFSGNTSSVGSGTTHTHSLNIAVSYVDVIICTKS